MSLIIVALPKMENAKKIQKILISRGYDNVVPCSTASAALNAAGQEPKGLLISSCRLSDMHYTQLEECLPQHYQILLIGSQSAVQEADSGMIALSTPIKIYDLLNTVDMLLTQVERRYRKQKKKPRVRSEREENYIKNAKMILMERNHLTEQDAHRYLQKWSMDSGSNLVETAQMILTLMYDEG